MKRTLIAAAIAALSTSAFAQAPTGEWVGSVSLGASFSQSYADVSNTAFALAAETSRTTTADKTAFYLTSVYGKTKATDINGNRISNENANNIKAGGRYEWNFGPMTYAFGSLDFERDRVAGLDLRSAVGLGVGYYFVKSDPLTFTVFGGIGYRHDDYRVGNDSFTELLIGEESIHKLTADTTFRQRLVVYPNLTESGEVRAAFDAVVSTKLVGAWNLNVSFADRYDSMISGAGTRKHDTLFMVGVGAKFGK